ncbi:MAG TPA: hypothetical protein VNM34_10910 [Verrucomicrobiae bacterium]|nr:hypothetical protein [Verrucomicrobiae bacterium]
MSIVGASGAPPFDNPPDSSRPATVLDAYLHALLSGDCAAGHALGTETFRKGNGELCGETTVISARVNGDPATPSSDEVVFASTLITTGTADGSVPAGEITWFYALGRQPDGSWRLTGGGSGP